MSSHREAPEISKDPVADSTDLYAFISPDAPGTVTILANYVPLQGPAGGPNFYEFGDDVRYDINVDNDGDGIADVTFRFRFNTVVEVGGTFLYNVGPITSLDAKTWNRRQFYNVWRIDWEPMPGWKRRGWGDRRAQVRRFSPTRRVRRATSGPARRPTTRSWPTRPSACCRTAARCLPASAPRVSTSISARSSTWGHLRPVQNLHLLPLASAQGVNATKDLNVHSIALQVPTARVDE